MATNSLDVLGLTPNQSYSIQVFATYTDAAGTPHVSNYSPALTITTPSLSASGSNFQTPNYGTDIQLSGGSLYAGTFPLNVGQTDLTLTNPAGTGVVLNQTGVGAYNGGVQEFFLNAKTGKAYFAGNLTAGAIKIGPGVDPTGTKNGIYINSYNYWYDDGTWSATGNNIAGALQGGSILKPAEVTGLTAGWSGTTTMTVSFSFDIAGVVAGVSSNQYAQDFLITLTPTSGPAKTIKVPVNKTSTSQLYALTLSLNQSLFGVPVTQFSSIKVQVEDSFGNITTGVTISAGYNYVSPLTAPTSLTITPVNNGYTVSYTSPTDPSFSYIEIAESTSSSSGPFNTVYTGKLNPATIITSSLSARWVEARFVDVLGVATTWYIYGSSIQPVSPTTISTAAPLPVTVNSAGFTSIVVGTSSSVSGSGTTITVTSPTFPIAIGQTITGTGISGVVTVTNVSGTGPYTVTLSGTGVSGSASGTYTFSSQAGEDVSITITAYNKSITAASGTSTITYTTGTTAHGFVNGDQVVISGITGGTGFNTSGIVSNATTYTFQLTSQSASGTPTSYTGAVVQYYNVRYIAKLTSGTQNGYFYLTPDGTSNVSQTFTILKRDMYNQFGAYYYTFSGLFITTGSNGANNTGASITSFSRTATVTSTTPILSTYAVADGYTAVYDFSATNATYGEVYQKHTSWGTITATIDYLTGTFVSNSTNQLVLSNVIDDDGNVITTAGDVNGAFPTGYQVFGANVPTNTYVTAVSYTAPNFTLTLNNSLTATGTGTYRVSGLIYSGTSPANITNNLYDPFYVIVRYYDDFGFSSNMSNISTVTPNNASSISNFTNAVNIGGTAGSVYVGAALKSATISTVSGSGTLMTYTTSTAHGLSSTDVVTVSGVVVGGTTVNNYNVTASAITVTGTTTFTISGTQTGAGTSGVVTNNGARVFMASSANTNNTSLSAGIFAFDNTGAIATTSLIANLSSGGYTFKTVNANIADWVIDSTHIQNTLGASANYVGLSATGNYSIWAGSPSSGNSTNNANFSVTPTGNVQARNISIIGSGQITGVTVSSTTISATYTTSAAHNLVPGQYINIAGFVTTSYNFNNIAITSVPSPTTFTISGVFTAGTGTGGTVVPILLSAGGVFNVTGTGILTATGVNVTGQITAQTGSITGNLTLGGSLYSNTIKTANITAVTPNATTGALYAASGHTFVAGDVISISGVAPYQYSGIWTISSVVAGTSFTVLSNLNTTAVTTATGSAISSGVQSFIINKSGLIFNSPTTQGVTTIDGNTGLLVTQSALIGGWNVGPSSITKTSTSGTLTLDSTLSQITASGYSTYTAGMSAPITGSSTDKVFWAGVSKVSPNFYVQADGTLVATNATVSGSVTANTIVAGASITSPVITSGLENASTPTSAGFYLSAGSTPSLLISNGTSYLQYVGGALTVAGGTITGTTINSSIINTATINGGTISGGTFSTSTGTTSNVIIGGTTVSWYDSGGALSQISSSTGSAANGLHFYVPGGVEAFAIYGSGTAGASNTNIMNQPLRIYANGDTSTGGSASVRNIVYDNSGNSYTNLASSSYYGTLLIQYV